MKHLLLSFLLFACAASAQEPATATVPDSAANLQAASEETGPVAVPEMSEKAKSYYASGNVLWWVNRLWDLLIPCAFLFTGFSARIRNWAQRLGRKWFFVIGIYLALFTALSFVIDLPLTYYQEFAREHAYGLSNQTFGKWAGDGVKSLLVNIVIAILFWWMPYLLLKKSPQRWWLYTGVLLVPFLLLLMLIGPVWIDPLFNKFGPMKNQALETKILALADRAGIEGSRVFEVEKSVDTKTVNAYVNGFMNTKRIVLWDTIIAKLNEEELLFVMGHEMGHYVLGHVIKSILFFALLGMLTLYAAHRLAGGLINKYQTRFGFSQFSDIASFPLLNLLMSVFILVITPIALTFTRYQEHEADRFGLEITQKNRPAATAFVKLQEENLGNPRPGLLYKLWRSSHPTLGDRIDFCNDYRPWEKGEALEYQSLFKSAEAQKQ